MTATIPDREPAQLRCGDTWRWTRSLVDYPATTWTLKYRYKTASTGFEIVATADGTDHSVTHAASTTGGYTAVSYNWTAWVESGAEKYTIAEGVAQLLPDFRTGDIIKGSVTIVASSSANSLSRIDSMIRLKSPKSSLVLPGPPGNRVSPLNRSGLPSTLKHIDPAV